MTDYQVSLQSEESIRAQLNRKDLRAYVNRSTITNSTIMYSEAYTEYDEPDIYDMLCAESFDDDTMGAECELLALMEFGTSDFEYSEGY